MEGEDAGDDGYNYRIVEDRTPGLELARIRGRFNRLIKHRAGGGCSLYGMREADVAILEELNDLCLYHSGDTDYEELGAEIRSVIGRYHASESTDYPLPDTIWSYLRDDTPVGIVLISGLITNAIEEISSKMNCRGSHGKNGRLFQLFDSGKINKDEYSAVIDLYDYERIAYTKISFDMPDFDTMMEWKTVYSKLCCLVFGS